jgi:hypothetical protein
MNMEPLTDAEFEELNFENGPIGPSSRGVCKVINGNSCGSGSLVGKRNGKSLVLTNAHVAGTRVGRTVKCTFPHANDTVTNGRVIMAGYSDKIMMDWAVVELDREMDLPHVKLMNEMPKGKHYTAGYPRCRGPYYQKIETEKIIYNGTVWQWMPNSIGGQSGSAVHSVDDDLQYGLLTWSWGGYGAGQTVRAIWWQYSNRAAVGFERPEGLIELTDNRAEDLDNGFFQETNITTLPIWAHLDDDSDDGSNDGGGNDGEPVDPEFVKKVLAKAESLQKESMALAELARSYKPNSGSEDGSDSPGDDGLLFGL